MEVTFHNCEQDLSAVVVAVGPEQATFEQLDQLTVFLNGLGIHYVEGQGLTLQGKTVAGPVGGYDLPVQDETRDHPGGKRA